MDYNLAYKHYIDFLKILTPVCERIEVVGSIKRADPKALTQGVHDLEFLIIPDPTRIAPVFGKGKDQPKNKLERLIADLRDDGVLTLPERPANGERYKKFTIAAASEELDKTFPPAEFNLELFIVTPRTWAIQNVIRTGPSAFSQRFVTNDNQVCFHKSSGRTYRGLLPAYYEYVKDETIIRVRHSGEVLDLKEERDAIRLLGLRAENDFWIPSDERYKYI